MVKLFQIFVVSLPSLPSLAYWTIRSAKDFLSKILSLLSSFFVVVHVYVAYISTRLTILFYIFEFLSSWKVTELN